MLVNYYSRLTIDTLLHIESFLDPLSIILLSCTGKIFKNRIYEKHKIVILRFYVKHLNSIDDVYTTTVSRKFVETLIKTMPFAQKVNSKILFSYKYADMHKYAELHIMSGDVDYFVHCNDETQMTLLNSYNIIVCKHYPRLVSTVVACYADNNKYISYCMIGARLINNLELVAMLKNKFPYVVCKRFLGNIKNFYPRMSRAHLIKNLSGCQMLFYELNRCIKLGFNELVKETFRPYLKNLKQNEIGTPHRNSLSIMLDNTIQTAGKADNFRLFRYIYKKTHIDYRIVLLHLYCKGLIFDNRLDRLKILHMDQHYLFDYAEIKISFCELLNSKASVPTIMFCIEHKISQPDMSSSILSSVRMRPDIIEYIDKFCLDRNSNVRYITNATNIQSVDLLIELGYALPEIIDARCRPMIIKFPYSKPLYSHYQFILKDAPNVKTWMALHVKDIVENGDFSYPVMKFLLENNLIELTDMIV